MTHFQMKQSDCKSAVRLLLMTDLRLFLLSFFFHLIQLLEHEAKVGHSKLFAQRLVVFLVCAHEELPEPGINFTLLSFNLLRFWLDPTVNHNEVCVTNESWKSREEPVMRAYLLLFSTFLKFTSFTSVGCCAALFLLKPTRAGEDVHIVKITRQSSQKSVYERLNL